MALTPNESRIVTQLRRVRVARFHQLAIQLDLSAKTVYRALVKAGYFTSINRNASFVTLKDVAQFDQMGLWTYEQIHFSKYGNLRETLSKLVEQAPSGYTLQELEGYVGTRAHNHLSQLVREGKVRRFRSGRFAVYVSAGFRRARQQEDRRRKEEEVEPTVVRATKSPALLPPGMDPLTVIRVLLRLLQSPDASFASLARSLQARQVPVHADQIRHLLDFYGLKKTTRGS